MNLTVCHCETWFCQTLVSQKNLSWVCKQRATFSCSSEHWRLLFILSTLSSSPSPRLSGFPIFSINHQIESFTSTWVISALPWEKEVTWARKTKSLKQNGWLKEGGQWLLTSRLLQLPVKCKTVFTFRTGFLYFQVCQLLWCEYFSKETKLLHIAGNEYCDYHLHLIDFNAFLFLLLFSSLHARVHQTRHWELGIYHLFFIMPSKYQF